MTRLLDAWHASIIPYALLLLALAPRGADAQVPPPASASADSSAKPGSAAATPTAPTWLVSDDAGRVVTVVLQVAREPGGPATLNGHRDGGLQLVVPLGWTVQWDWHNADSTAPHSLVVMAEREKLPTEGGHPAFTNAMTRMVSAGLPAGTGDRTTFTADEAGWYWMLCGVPGHAVAGEYIGLRVDPGARTGSVKAK